MTIGKKIQQLRKNKGVTQEVLADNLGVSAQAVSKWEQDNSAPDIFLLPDIAGFFGITIDELFTFSREKQYERIENMIDSNRMLSNEEFLQSESFLQKEISLNDKEYKAVSMLADLYHYQATLLDSKAFIQAKKALALCPNNNFDLNTLNNSGGGTKRDWHIVNREKVIEHLNILTADKTNAFAYLHLLDNLIDAGRLDEANERLVQLRRLNDQPLCDVYAVLIEQKRKGFEAVADKYADIAARYDKDWRVLMEVANSYAFAGEAQNAIALYEKCFELQPKPRYIDALESIASLQLGLGNATSAIDAYQREITLLCEEWNLGESESVNVLKDKIKRLQA